MGGRHARGRMTDGDLVAALVAALALAAVGLPGLGGLIAVVALVAWVLRAERRSGEDRRQPARRRRQP
jgi:hypothetical protein